MPLFFSPPFFMRSSRPWRALIISIWSIAHLMQGQVEDVITVLPPEAVRLREEMQEKFRFQSQTLKQQYAAALEKLEKEVALGGDYDQALKAQQRRRQLASPFASLSATAGNPDSVLLLPKDARLNGSVNVDKKNGVLTGWKTIGSSAEWSLMKFPPGDYTVILYYAVGEPELRRRSSSVLEAPLVSGGDLVFYQDSSIDRSLEQLKSAVVSTGGWDTFQSLVLGELSVKSYSADFKLESRSSASGGLMVCQGVELVPKKPAGAATAEPMALANLKAEHAEKVFAIKKPIVSQYAEKLRELQKQAGEDAKLAPLLAMLKTEENRAVEAGKLSGPSPPTSSGPAAGITPAVKPEEAEEVNLGQGAPFAGGQQLFRRVTYVPHPQNTGSNFHILIGDTEYPVRVNGVLSPPPNQNDGTKVDAAAQYFGLTQHDTAEIGRAAKKFTSTVLNSRTFVIRTQGEKDKEGNYLIDLRLGTLGNFAKVLVARGFASLQNEDLKDEDHQSVTMRELLKATEKKARVGKEGAWGLAGADENEQTAPETPPQPAEFSK